MLSERAKLVRGYLSDRRAIIQTVLAGLFVPTVVLLVLDQTLPFPHPGEKPLFVSRGWPAAWSLDLGREGPQERVGSEGTGESVGGGSYSLPPLSIMTYRVKRGDTLERIADRFGMELDTLSSLNRPGGKGVHDLVVGESIKIPNQDGIYLTVKDNFEALCAKYNLDPEQVLAVNSLDAGEIASGAQLFFPGAKHEGYDLSLSLGVAISSPLSGGWLSSPFGKRLDPFTGEPSYHSGIDIAAAEGASVRSASSGTVTSVDYNDVLGNFVVVRAPRGFQYVYGHLSAALVTAGSRVSQGAILGRVGSTGHATGPHLHFSVWKDGVLQNPRKYMPAIR